MDMFASVFKEVTTKITTNVRTVVSGDKVRYKEDGFDLDLTFITPRIVGALD